MRVLGVDPGLTRCGIGVVDGAPGRTLSMLSVEVLRTPASDELGSRLAAIERAVSRHVAEHQPERLAIERVFSQHNVRSVMGTARSMGLDIV